VIDVDFRDHAHCFEDVDRVVRRVILKNRFQNARRFEHQLDRNDQRLRQDGDFHPARVGRLADLDHQILDRRLREIGRRRQLVRLVAGHGRMRGRNQ